MKKKLAPSYSYHDVKIIAREICYQGFFQLEKYRLQFKLFNGQWSKEIEREIFERGMSVAVLLLDPLRDEIVLIEQFRVGVMNSLEKNESPWLIEIVAGALESNQKLEDAAFKETKEETGLKILEFFYICDYWVSPGSSSEKIFLFCARIDARNAKGYFGLAEESEDIKVICLPIDEALLLVENGKIKNVNAIVALQWLKINRKKYKELFKLI